MLDLLPKRYPTMFRIENDVFQNLVTGSEHCISQALSDPRSMLRHLGENVEEDFYLMRPNAEGEYVLQGFVSCFPQGLLPSAKVGLSVSEIHAPVPGYDGRLKKGVNRCFQRMARGQSVGRLNVCRRHPFLGECNAYVIPTVGHPNQSLGFVSTIRRRQYPQDR